MYRVEAYAVDRKAHWDAIVKQSRNGTFLFYRDFMEYHSDRFSDFSLLIYKGSNIIAALPAHRDGDALVSHGGLTYGGLVYGPKVKLTDVLESYKALLAYLTLHDVNRFYIKMVPHIYHKMPAQEQEYVLFLLNAKLARRDSLAVIDTRSALPFSKDRRQCIRRGVAAGLEVREEANFSKFWETLLVPNSRKKHGVVPVHSLAEIELLHSRFPENIRQFNVYNQEQLVAGTTIFVTDKVAHPQYIAGQEDKNSLGSLDFLYGHLITNVFADKAYFDFGISNEEQGRKLNHGLLFWKESFGARTITQDFYEVAIANASLLDNVVL